MEANELEKAKYDQAFNQRYTYEYALQYYLRHKNGFFKRLSNFLEQRMIRKALKIARFPTTIVDLPCGAGRFWQSLLHSGALAITGVDRSPGMLQVCEERTSPPILSFVTLKEGDATCIPLADKSSEAVICIRLLHHINDHIVRMQMYKEFQRVAQNTVCISFWVDGNFKSFRNQGRSGKNNYASIKELEAELIRAGFSIMGKVDMLKGYLPWRMYVLGVCQPKI